MIYLELKNKESIVFSNIPEKYKIMFRENKNSKLSNIRSFFKKDGQTITWLITNDKDLCKSSKLFNKTFKLIHEITNGLYKHYSLVTLSNTHTIATIQAKMAQQLEDLIGENTQRGEYQKSVEKVKTKIQSSLDETAKLVCDFSKRVEEIDKHLKSLEILDNKVRQLKLVSHPLKKMLLRIYAPFESKFQDKSIYIKGLN